MKTSAKVVGLAAIVVALLWVDPAQAQVRLRLGNVYAADQSASKGADKMGELVASKTNGQVIVETFHNSVLGSEREMIESVRAGSLEMILTGVAGVGRYAQILNALELPYEYKDLDQAYRAGQAIFPEVETIMLKEGIRPLSFFTLGPRVMAAKRPIRSLEDMKGLRLRVPESAVYVGMARALGATPTPISMPEVYTSLQSGVADAAEIEMETLFTSKWFEPARYITPTNHIYHLFYAAIAERSFQRLTPPQQRALREAAQEAAVYQLQLAKDGNNFYFEKLKSAGATMIPLADVTPFSKALAPFNKSYTEQLGPAAVSLLEKVMAIK